MGNTVLLRALETRLNPGERVIFRGHHDFRSMVTVLVPFFLFLKIFEVGLCWILGEPHIWWSIDIKLAGITALVAWYLWVYAALVTEARVIYVGPGVNPMRSIKEVPLSSIEKVEYRPLFGEYLGSVSIKRRGDADLDIRTVPKLKALRDVIAHECGLP